MNTTKKFCLVLSALIIFTGMSFSTFATDDETQYDDLNKSSYTKYTEYINNFIAEVSVVDPLLQSWNDSNIINIAELYSMPESNDIKALLYEIECSNGDQGYLIIDYNRCIVVEFAPEQSPFSQYLETQAQSLPSQEYKLIYYPLSYYISYQDNSALDLTNSSVVYDCFTGEPVQYNTNNIQSYTSEEFSEPSSIPITEKQIAKNNLKNNQFSIELDAYPPSLTIPGVPAYLQTSECKCIPTSILNILGYWDSKGYPNLISTVATARLEIVSALINNGGDSKSSSIPGAVSDYVSRKGYNGQVDPISNPGFFDLQFEINYGDPCLVGFPGTPFSGAHMTAGVGYSTISSTEYVIVHDNHSSAARTTEFANVDYIGGIDIY